MENKQLFVTLPWDPPWVASYVLRIREPFKEKGIRFINACRFDRERHLIQIERKLLEAADVIVLQRFILLFEEAVREICISAKKKGKKIIYDLDDNIFSPPEEHPNRLELERTSEVFLKLCHFFDEIIVSTEFLRKEVQSITPVRTKVVPTKLPKRLREMIRKKAKETLKHNGFNPIKIIYQGTPTHHHDIQILKEVVPKIKKKFKNKVMFLSFGIPIGFFDSYIPFIESYYNFCKLLPSIGAHIGLAPLKDNPFNRAKSDIKKQEYDACMIKGIYSKVYPFGTAGEDPNEWYQQLEEEVGKRLS